MNTTFCVLEKRKQKMVFILPFIGDFSNSVLNFLFVVIGVSYGFSPSQIGLILAAYGMTYVIMPALLGQISDKINHKISLIVSVAGQILLSVILIMILSYFSSYSSSSPSSRSSIIFYFIFIEQLLRGMFYSFYWPVIQAYLSEMGEHSHRAHKESINNFCISWGLGMAIGPFIGGIFSEIEIIFGFWSVLISHIIALIIVLSTIQKSKNKNNNSHKNGISNENEDEGDEKDFNISKYSEDEFHSKNLHHTKTKPNLKKVNTFLFGFTLIFDLNA